MIYRNALRATWEDVPGTPQSFDDLPRLIQESIRNDLERANASRGTEMTPADMRICVAPLDCGRLIGVAWEYDDSRSA